MKFYTPGKLSENIRETPEGFLLCLAVPIARTGWQVYSKDELPVLEPGPDGTIRVFRSPKEVLRAETIASFQGKSITIRHPKDFVAPDNWQELTHGMAQNVRPGGKGEDGEDCLISDLLITDHMAIGLVKNGLREVSCGYEADYEQTGEGEGAVSNIIGNHVALVEEGRAGSSYAINDHKGKADMDAKKMIERLKAKFGAKVVDEAMEEKKEEKTGDEGANPTASNVSYDEVKKSIDALGEMVKGLMKKDEAPSATATNAAPVEVVAKDEPAPAASMEDRMKALETAVAKLLESNAPSVDESYEARVRAYEKEGMSRSDAQGAVDAEDMQKGKSGDEESEESEEVGDEGEEEESTMTGDSASRVEILAPGLKVSKNEKATKIAALKVAYATVDGKKIIDTLTSGKGVDKLEAGSVDMVFNAASELLKQDRVTAMSRTKTHDFNSSLDDAKSGVMTAEMMNEKNAKHYGLRA